MKEQRHARTQYFTELLHDTGCKVTPTRLGILLLLDTLKKPMSVPTIMRKSGKKRLDTVTAYRTLMTLQKRGLVRQVDLRHGATAYELSSQKEHHHAICVHCERVEDITECCEERMDDLALQQSGFAAITQHSLEFFGVCQKCRRISTA